VTHEGRRHTPEQIVRKLHDADQVIAEGKTMAVVLKQLGVSEQTYYRWRKAYGELSPDEAKREGCRNSDAPLTSSVR
jgi:putative transposase